MAAIFVGGGIVGHNMAAVALKIEISSIVHCCFSISQNELKF
jgi:hypothetical protein